jgi:alpha-ribazole phosphatase
MKIRIVRHTQVALPSGICYGFSDIPLAESWEKDIMKVTEQIQDTESCLVYSSPLIRCKILAEKFSNNVILDDRLKELNFGKWELQTWDKIEGPEADRWMKDYVNLRCPGGESYIDLCERVKSFLIDLQGNVLTSCIIVTHAGVMHATNTILKHMPLHQSFETKIAFGEVMELSL